MKIQHLMALVVLSVATVPGARAAVLAGPITNAANAHAYYLLSANTWTASEAEAHGLGGHLVTINDAAENQWVVNTFYPLTGVASATLWIGLNDAANQGQFVWASGEPVTYTYWYPGGPSNVSGEDYAAIFHSIFVSLDGRWNAILNPTPLTFGVVEVPVPVAVTQPADQFMPGSSRLNGLANPNGSPTLAWFEWGTSIAYGNITPPQSVGSGSNYVGFSNVLVGLVSGTEYHFRARASNAFGSFAGLDQTFNLNSQRPVVTTLPAEQLYNTNALLRGQVNPRGWPTAAWFEWGTSTNYGNLIGVQDVGQGSSVSSLDVVLDGLMIRSNYHYRVVATNAFGGVYGADQTFKMRQRATVLAGPLGNVANGHAYYLLSADTWTASEAEARRLGGHLVTINDAAENQWVLNTFFPLTGVPYASLWIGLNDATNEGQFVWASGEPVTFAYWYPGEPNNLGGEDYATIRHPSEVPPTGSWNDLSDTSGLVNPNAPIFGVVEVPTLLPVAVTQPADQFMPGSARLNGLANPNGSPTLAWFEWGTSLAYGNATPPQSVGSGNNAVGFSNVLVGLVNGTEYHFRARASNAFGFAAGLDQTFNLSNQRPVVTTLAADQLTTNSARLRGQVNPRGWPTAAWFEWGTDTNYGNLIGTQDVGQGSSVSNLSVVLNGLTSGPNYHYRLVATNAFGAEYGADQTFNLSHRPPTTNTWTGADPSGYWSAPANWSPAGVPVNGNDLVFPGGLPPGDMVSTNDLTDSFFRSIRFVQGGGHTIRGNPITLTNRANVIINNGTNVIACDLTFSGTPSTPNYQFPSIWGYPGELTVIGNVGGGSLYVSSERLVIRGQFTGGSLRVQYGSLALYGDNPHAVFVEFYATSFSTLRVQGSQPNLNITRLREMESAECPSVIGDGLVGDVTGCGSITPDSTLSVKNVSGRLDIKLNGTNVGEYGRLIASGNVSLSGRLLPSAGFNPQAGQVFTIVEKTSPGPIANAIFGPEGSFTTLNGMPFRISYVGGDGNDVTLTAPVPPPIISQQAYLKAHQVDSQDYFGRSVAVSGDTVVVGAEEEASSTTGVNSTPNESAGNAGAAYVFVRSGTNWTQQAYLKAHQVNQADYFGISVAVSGDTLVVGAPQEDSSTTGINSTPNESAFNAGAAYVFVRSGTNWTQQAYLKAHRVKTGADSFWGSFGSSVAVSGDTVVVTGINRMTNDTNGMFFDEAAAYVFVRSETNWTQQAYLKTHQVTSNDVFRLSVAVSGDTVVVGEPYEDSSTTGVNSTPNESAPQAGAAYVFVRSGTNWTQQAFLKAHQVTAGDVFGWSVGVSGDTVAVGAFGEDSSTTGVNSTPDESVSGAGAAYVFARSGTNWTQQAYLKAHRVIGRDFFGMSVGVSGDAVVVGAEEEAVLSGAAYVFVRSGTNWTQQAYLKAHNAAPVDYFGRSVAVSGDTVVVGATHEDSSTTGVNSTPNESATYAGAAYVFAGVGPPLFISQITSVNPFQFQFDGGSRPAFEVEASTNLTNWVFISNATNISGSLFQFTDSSVTNFPYRFYRLKVP